MQNDQLQNTKKKSNFGCKILNIKIDPKLILTKWTQRHFYNGSLQQGVSRDIWEVRSLPVSQNTAVEMGAEKQLSAVFFLC